MSIDQALYDNIKDYQKRFDGNILEAIMMKTSKAGGIENDSTVERLIKCVKEYEYAALYIINIILIIN